MAAIGVCCFHGKGRHGGQRSGALASTDALQWEASVFSGFLGLPLVPLVSMHIHIRNAPAGISGDKLDLKYISESPHTRRSKNVGEKKVIFSCQPCQYGLNFPGTHPPAGYTGLPSVRRIDPASGHISAKLSPLITDVTAQPAESWPALCCFHGHTFHFGS